jgi:tRNA(Ile)-lysidine synthase
VLVGISGGADSVALLCGLHRLREAVPFEVRAAHLNHQIRGADAEEDAEWTGALCARLEIPIKTERIDVPAHAAACGANLEEAARAVRYAFFERAARSLACSHVAVAHTADDRIETVLHHLLRGSGLAGLRGMRPTRSLAFGVTLIRPLLRVRRMAIEDWLAEIGQDFRSDATNADQTRTRSRIRGALLPVLDRDFGPRIRDSILRFADQADEIQAALEQLAARALDACLADDVDDLCRLTCRPLESQPRHLVREAFVELWRRKQWPRQQMGFADWDRLYQIVLDGGSATLPGSIQVTRRGGLIVLRREASRESSRDGHA